MRCDTRRVRTIALLALGLVLGLACPALAGAEPMRNVAPLPEQISGPRSVLHYTTVGADAITAADAERLAVFAGVAPLIAFDASGFDAPPDDGDGRIDYYVHLPAAITTDGERPAGVAYPDMPLTLRTGYVVISPTLRDASYAAARRVVVHETAHLAQLALTPAARLNISWLREATANWTSIAVDRSPAPTGTVPVPGVYLFDTGLPLDCEYRDPCDETSIDKGGYGRWHVLAQWDALYGPGFVRAWWDEVARKDAWPRGVEITALGTVLASHGVTLGQGFTALARANLAGLDVPTAAGVRPVARVDLPMASGKPATLRQVVDHLGIENVALRSQTCAAGRLQLAVDVPAGAGTEAVFWQNGAAPVVLTGGRAELPWRGCEPALLSLPNGSPTSDRMPFMVRATLTQTPPLVTNLRVRLRDRTALFTASTAGPTLLAVQRRTGKRWVTVKALRPTMKVGANRVSLTRFLKRPGRYRVTVFPVGADKLTRATVTVR